MSPAIERHCARPGGDHRCTWYCRILLDERPGMHEHERQARARISPAQGLTVVGPDEKVIQSWSLVGHAKSTSSNLPAIDDLGGTQTPYLQVMALPSYRIYAFLDAGPQAARQRVAARLA